MSVYLDRKYLLLASVSLTNFKHKKDDLYNFRCCYCGDSQKKKSKSRGFVFRKNNDYFYRCFNCGVSTTFYKFLEHVNPSLAKEYSLERYRNGEDGNHNYTKPKFNFKKPIFSVSDISLPSIKSLPDDHEAKQYILNRKIPKVYHKDLFYSENFKEFIQSIYPECEKTFLEEKRIIIPFRDENNSLKMLQGRSLSPTGFRYVTVKLDKEYPKIFGLDRLDKTKKIYIVEAPLDSFFIKNSVATADSNLEFALTILGNVFVEKILIPDIQPRNEYIVKNINKWIEKGYNVCLLPDNLKGKDLNEIVQNGMSKKKLEEMVEQYTFSGLRAKIEFQKWKSV